MREDPENKVSREAVKRENTKRCVNPKDPFFRGA